MARPMASDTGPDTDTLTVSDTGTEEVLFDDTGDHDRYSHYVKKDKIMASAVEGTPVRALCGKLWVPSRNPDRYGLCPECKEIFESLP